MLSTIQPWAATTAENDRAKAIALSSETLRICGIVMQPFIPAKAEELLDALGVPPDQREWRQSEWLAGSVSEHLPGKLLFPKK
jgi:methionyl-tRNA synthetase